jgi:hypothetical protein
MPSDEIVDLALGFVALIAVTFLNSADELFGIALRARNIVIRELSPLRLDFPFELPPFAFQDVFVHKALLLDNARTRPFEQDLCLWRDCDGLKRLAGGEEHGISVENVEKCVTLGLPTLQAQLERITQRFTYGVATALYEHSHRTPHAAPIATKRAPATPQRR